MGRVSVQALSPKPSLRLWFNFLGNTVEWVETVCLLCKIKQQQPPLCTQRRNSMQLTLERLSVACKYEGLGLRRQAGAHSLTHSQGSWVFVVPGLWLAATLPQLAALSYNFLTMAGVWAVHHSSPVSPCSFHCNPPPRPSTGTSRASSTFRFTRSWVHARSFLSSCHLVAKQTA